MRDLSTVRQGWEQINQAEARLDTQMTAQQSFRQWLQLQAAFESQLLRTATIFGSERIAALAELQARLRRLVE
jgi:hypothetical protein